MVLDLNNKNYIARYNDVAELIIKLELEEDILFFKEWQKLTFNSPKVDYIKDIRYAKVGETGTLKHCFPILNLNEDKVKIVYDRYIIDR